MNDNGRCIKLTKREQDLLGRVRFDIGSIGEHSEVIRILAAAAELTESLLGRDAIPKVRLLYFTDPGLNVRGHGKSRQEVFEGNGTRGREILEHPHFLKYLLYFIYGPNLPEDTISRFTKVIEDDAGTEGMVLNQIKSTVRAETRGSGIDKHVAAEEFFKLALETGLEVEKARVARDAALSAR